MDPKDLATALVNRRLDTLRQLGRRAVAARTKPPEPPVVNVAAPEQPVINVTVVVPPEAIRVEFPPIPAPQVTVNVPEQKTPVVKVEPRIEVQAARAPSVKVEPRIEVTVPETKTPERARTATIKHADGTKSTVELT